MKCICVPLLFALSRNFLNRAIIAENYSQVVPKKVNYYNYKQSSLNIQTGSIFQNKSTVRDLSEKNVFDFISPPYTEMDQSSNKKDTTQEYEKNRVKRYAFTGSRWGTRYLTYKIRNFPKYLSPKLVARDISNAFSLWAKVSSLSFKRTTGRAHISIQFVSPFRDNFYPFTGKDSKFDGIAMEPPSGAIFFDNAKKWTTVNYPCRKCRVVFHAAVHEIGHALGLAHSRFKNAVMYPAYPSRFGLDKDDILGIQRLYGS